MKYVKICGISLLAALLIALILALKFCGGEEPTEKEEFHSSVDYFNGEVTEVSDEYLVMKPTAEWTWKETTRVVIPATQVRGDSEPQKIQTPLYEGTWSDLKPGDKIQVGFNAKSMEWTDDVVRISVVFMLYRVTDDESKE